MDILFGNNTFQRLYSYLMETLSVYKTSEKRSLIYVIDDCGLQKLLLEKTLNQQGFKVCAFTNGFDLIEALDEECPDLIISDIDMPHIDGMELIREVKNRQVCNSVPFWFLSSFDISEIKEKVRSLGAEKFVTKPFDGEQLIEDIRSRLGIVEEISDSK